MKIQTVSGGSLVTIGQTDDLREAFSILKIHPNLVLFDGDKHIVSLNGKITTIEAIRDEMGREKTKRKIPLHRAPGPFESEEDVRREMEKMRMSNRVGSFQQKLRNFQQGLREAQLGIARGLRGDSELSRITARIFGRQR